MAEHEPQLLLVEEVNQTGVQHDERLVHPDGHRLGDRVLHHEQFRPDGGVQGVQRLGEEPVDVGELPLVDPDRRGEEQQAVLSLAEQPGQSPQDGVEPGQRPQGHQRRTVGRVLPGPGTDSW